MSAVIGTYAKYPLTIVSAKGSFVYDEDGGKYLDFYGGHAVCILGHCPSTVVEAIKKQSETLLFYSNIVKTLPQEKLAELLTSTLLPENYQVFFCNSGSEANEAAVKMARKYTGKKKIISFNGAFHGRSISNLGVTGLLGYHQFSPDLLEHTYFAQLGDMESVKAGFVAGGDDVAAVICEGIQSIGGMKMAEKKFYQDLEKLCNKNGVVLIFDEIQTGLGRCGDFWFCESVGVKPDIITAAKGLASGLPVGATIVRAEISSMIKEGEHGSTFGGGPVPMAAGIATVEEILKIKDVNEKSERIVDGLKKISGVDGVVGKGLLLGIKVKEEAPGFVGKCLGKGLLLGSSSDKKVFRIMPPLNISNEEIDLFLKIIEKVLTQENDDRI